MPDVLKWAIVALSGYLMGNFATGIMTGRLFGKMDIREAGSKNAGTTNVLRTLGWVPSLLTFGGDALKGWLGASLGYWLCGIYGAYVGGICVILGHVWPVFYRFKGGKGIATSFGVILAMYPLIAVCLLAVQVIVVALTRYMSVASILSSALFTVLVGITRPGHWGEIGLALTVSALAIFSHRTNITRLMKGEENKLDFSKINRLSRKRSGKAERKG